MEQGKAQPHGDEGHGRQVFTKHHFPVRERERDQKLHGAGALFTGNQSHGHRRYEKQVDDRHQAEEHPQIRLVDDKKRAGEEPPGDQQEDQQSDIGHGAVEIGGQFLAEDQAHVAQR